MRCCEECESAEIFEREQEAIFNAVRLEFGESATFEFIDGFYTFVAGDVSGTAEFHEGIVKVEFA